MVEIYNRFEEHLGTVRNGQIHNTSPLSHLIGEYRNGVIYNMEGIAVAHYDNDSLTVDRTQEKYDILHKERQIVRYHTMSSVIEGTFEGDLNCGGEVAALIVPHLLDSGKVSVDNSSNETIVPGVASTDGDGSGILVFIVVLMVAFAAIYTALFMAWPLLFKQTLGKADPGAYEYAMLAYVFFAVFLGYALSLSSKKLSSSYSDIYLHSCKVIGLMLAAWVVIEALTHQQGFMEAILGGVLALLASFIVNLLPAIFMVPITSYLKKKRG